MTDEEATSFKNYEEWADTLVHFTLRNAPNHARRISHQRSRKEKVVTKLC